MVVAQVAREVAVAVPSGVEVKKEGTMVVVPRVVT